MSGTFFWITSRAAGTAALVLVSASVGVGVSMSGRLMKGRGPDLRVIHEALSLSALAMIALHGVSLLLDSYFHPSIVDLTVPFAMNYREPYMGIGIVAGWGIAVLGLSYYMRARIGVARWRVIHRFTAVGWVLSVIHTLGEGSDSGRGWFLAIVALAVIPSLLLVLARFVSRSGGAPARPGVVA